MNNKIHAPLVEGIKNFIWNTVWVSRHGLRIVTHDVEKQAFGSALRVKLEE